MKRSVWFWIYFVIAIILAIYFATRIIMLCTGRGTDAYIRNISISADGANKDLTPIATAVAIAPGTRSYNINVAQWTDGTQYFPLSADGTIVNKPSPTRSENTVLFRGDVPDDISEITQAAHNIIADLDYLEWIEQRRWNLHTTGGITVMLPEKNPDTAIAGLIVLDTNHNILSKDLELIDMRDSARILVK